jgi:membrane-bound lytic murein transglycosylase D
MHPTFLSEWHLDCSYGPPEGAKRMNFFAKLGVGVLLYLGIPALVLTGISMLEESQGRSMPDYFRQVSVAEIPDAVKEATSHAFDKVSLFLPAFAEDAIGQDAQKEAQEQIALEQRQQAVQIAADKTNQKSAGEPDEISKIPLEFADPSISPLDIINDKYNRIPLDFKIPQDLKSRVGFWLDIYTRYSSQFSVIHDERRPWIVYDIVDLRPIYQGPGNRFVKHSNDRKAIYRSLYNVRMRLAKLARKKHFGNLTGEEYKYFKLLEEVPGPRRQVLRKAAMDVRAQRGQKNFYRSGLITSTKYINEMEEIFAHYDLPVELVRLPLVESSFNEAAISKVGASGIWQFMQNTGKKFLKVGNLIDERNSPIKATEAAAKLMLSNFRILRSWPLALTAYNHGAGGVIRATKKLKTKNLADIVGRYRSRSFSFASENFYCEFLAALHADKYQEEVFGQMPKHPPLQSETALVKYSMRVRTLVDIVGITIEELKLFNPDFKRKAIAGSTYIPSGYRVLLPMGRKSLLDAFNEEADEARALVNKVARQTRG